MEKNKFLPWTHLLVFGLTIFLLFCLLFESFIVLPNLVGWLGRWHPLILHFPIVLLLMAAVLGLLGKKVPASLLAIATVSALVTAITGFFLGTQSSPKGELIFWHQWMGSVLAMLAVVWYVLADRVSPASGWIKGLQISLLLLVGFTGHYGGMITHGPDFLALPGPEQEKALPKNPLVYEHVVARMLDRNCVSCHNPNKKKGELLMTSLEDLRRGGETGPAFVAGKPEESEIIKRLRLPVADEEHMPPDGKKPLSEAEIKIVERWIALGASDTLRLDHLPESEPLAALIKASTQPQETNTWENLPKIADTTIQNLATDYLTIKRIKGGSDAVSVSLFMPPVYDPSLLLQLKRVAANIVELDLSGLPLSSKEIAVVAQCKNLERLEVDRTPVTDTEFASLAGLAKLKHLKAYGIAITDKSIPVLKGFKALKTLYVWETQLTETGLTELKRSLPSLRIEGGIDKDLKDAFTDTDSIP
jgi:hypothetical protein